MVSGADVRMWSFTPACVLTRWRSLYPKANLAMNQELPGSAATQEYGKIRLVLLELRLILDVDNFALGVHSLCAKSRSSITVSMPDAWL